MKRYSEKHHGRKKRKTPTRHAVEDYPSTPLSALLYCGTCDARMNACNTNNGQKAQRCPIAYRSKKERKKKVEIGDVRACTMHGLVPVDRAEKALFDFLLERLNAAPEWIGDVYEQAKSAYRAEAAAVPDELTELKAKLAAVNEAVKNLTQAVASGQVQGAALAALSTGLNEREVEKVVLATRIATLEANAAKAEAFPLLAEVRKQLSSLPPLIRERSRETALLLRRFFGRVEAHQILQPGKKRGYMELRFHFNPMAAVELAFPDDGQAEFENRTVVSPPVIGELIVLPLGEPTRLDQLMPEIIRLREVEGLSWKRIAKQLKVHEAWAAEYYRRRKEASN